MSLYEVTERATGARMSRSPKPLEFKAINRKGEMEYFGYGDLMGTTLFNDAGKALDWLREQGLNGTHHVSLAQE